MKLFNTVLTLTLLLKIIQAERINNYEDYLRRKRIYKPFTEPEPSKPSICTCNSLKHLQGTYKTPIRPYMSIINTGMIKDGTIITTTVPASKYSPEQLQAMYKTNPYTNKPYNL